MKLCLHAEPAPVPTYFQRAFEGKAHGLPVGGAAGGQDHPRGADRRGVPQPGLPELGNPAGSHAADPQPELFRRDRTPGRIGAAGGAGRDHPAPGLAQIRERHLRPLRGRLPVPAHRQQPNGPAPAPGRLARRAVLPAEPVALHPGRAGPGQPPLGGVLRQPAAGEHGAAPGVAGPGGAGSASTAASRNRFSRSARPPTGAGPTPMPSS